MFSFRHFIIPWTGTGAGLGAMIFMFSTGSLVDYFGYTLVLIIFGLPIPSTTAALWILSRNTEDDMLSELPCRWLCI